MTKPEIRHLKNRVADLGKQIAAHDRRWRELRRIVRLVDADRRWLAEEPWKARTEADRIRGLADSLRIANKRAENFASRPRPTG